MTREEVINLVTATKPADPNQVVQQITAAQVNRVKKPDRGRVGPEPHTPLALGEEIFESSDPQDRVIVEIARECDRLDKMVGAAAPNRKNRTVLSQISKKRVEALKVLADQLESRRLRKSGGTGLQIFAQFLKAFADAMSENNISPQHQEIIINATATKVEKQTSLQKVLTAE